MRGAKIYLVLLVGACMLAGCAGMSPDDASVQSVSTSQQPVVEAQSSSSVAMVTDITKKAVPDSPGVARVVLTLDKKASYSTSREGNRLIINVFNATMKSSIKQLDVQDPVITSITAKQVGKSVKSVVELVNQDVAYRPSTGTNPFQILVDVWQISPKTALQQTSTATGVSTVPAPVQSLDTEGQRTKDVTLDLQQTSSADVLLSPAPPSDDVPAQLEWFSEKLSQVLQERERLKQSLLEAEKSFAVKDSMIQVLERKVKEANARVVELEEELIKMRSTTSLAEQNEQALQNEISQLLAQLEQTTGTQLAQADVSQPGQIKTRSERLLDSLTLARQKTQTELEDMQNRIAMLTQERDELQEQADTCSAEVASLRRTTAQLAMIEQQLKVKEVEFSRLRQAIGAAAQLVTDSSVVPSSTVQPEIQAAAPEVSAAEQPASSQIAVATESSAVTPQDDQLVLADLINQAELLAADSAAEYVLGPNDVVSIKVLKEENLDKTVTVSSDGFITYPLLGDLRVDGLTTGQLDAQITSLLARDYLVDPDVIIEITKQRSKKVYIMGMVKQPGYHEIQGDQRLLGTLLNAGGPSSFNTEARVLRLPKEPGDEPMETLSPIIVDLQKLFVEGDQTQNILLRDGDVLMVAEKTPGGVSGEGLAMGPNQFYVVGSVVTPGVYTYKANDTVLDAILRAGGFTEFASMNSTKVVRESDGKTRTFQIKMKDVMEKGDMEKNIAILPGDMIIVPESFF